MAYFKKASGEVVAIKPKLEVISLIPSKPINEVIENLMKQIRRVQGGIY